MDSQYDIGNSIWDAIGYRGFDACLNLKSTIGWSGGGNGIDLFGFSGLPAGERISIGTFYGIGIGGCWWTATESSTTNAWDRFLDSANSKVYRIGYDQSYGFSVRCVKDN